MRHCRVVLNLPESLTEAFPFGGFSKLLLGFIVGKQIFGPQECPGVDKQVTDYSDPPPLTVVRVFTLAPPSAPPSPLR